MCENFNSNETNIKLDEIYESQVSGGAMVGGRGSEMCPQCGTVTPCVRAPIGASQKEASTLVTRCSICGTEIGRECGYPFDQIDKHIRFLRTDESSTKCD